MLARVGRLVSDGSSRLVSFDCSDISRLGFWLYGVTSSPYTLPKACRRSCLLVWCFCGAFLDVGLVVLFPSFSQTNLLFSLYVSVK